MEIIQIGQQCPGCKNPREGTDKYCSWCGNNLGDLQGQHVQIRTVQQQEPAQPVPTYSSPFSTVETHILKFKPIQTENRVDIEWEIARGTTVEYNVLLNNQLVNPLKGRKSFGITQTTDILLKVFTKDDPPIELDSQYYQAVFQPKQTTTTPQQQPLLAPRLIPTAGNGKVSLSWNEVPDATEYILEMKSGQDYGACYNGTSRQTTVDQLTNGQAYTFVVTACNKNQRSARSPEATATPIAPTPTPPAPTNRQQQQWSNPYGQTPTFYSGQTQVGTGRLKNCPNKVWSWSQLKKVPCPGTVRHQEYCEECGMFFP